MSKLTRELERRLAAQVVESALRAGYVITVSTDSQEVLKFSANKEEILKNMFDIYDTSYIVLYLWKSNIAGHEPGDGDYVGYVHCVEGNSGYDFISDYTTNLETLLAPAHAIAKQYEPD